MLKRNKFLLSGIAVAVLAVGPWVVRASAVVDPPSPKSLAKAEPEAKHLLRLMDKDQNGKVSKEEFMMFMSAEFDRLDKDKSGALDVNELNPTKLAFRPSR